MSIRPENNLGSYVNHMIPGIANQEFLRYIGYNAINKNEYPEVTEAELALTKCLAVDFCQGTDKVVGVPTTGSTEAAMVALLSAIKWWEASFGWDKIEMQNSKPNIVLDINSHHSWERIATYLGVETRYWVPELDWGELGVNGIRRDDISILIDKNTILVVPVLGYTTIGLRDNIEWVDKLISEINKKFPRRIPVKIHVDAAIGAFTWQKYDEYDWGFTLNNVVSMNVSNHKYGMSYCGLGWCLFSDELSIHPDLYKETNYLAGTFKSIGFSFSKNAAHLMSNKKLLVDHPRLYQHELGDIKEISDTLKVAMMNNLYLELLPNTTSPGIYWTGTTEYLESIERRCFEKGISVPISTYKTKTKNINVQRLIPRFGMNKESLLKIVNEF